MWRAAALSLARTRAASSLSRPVTVTFLTRTSDESRDQNVYGDARPRRNRASAISRRRPCGESLNARGSTTTARGSRPRVAAAALTVDASLPAHRRCSRPAGALLPDESGGEVVHVAGAEREQQVAVAEQSA